MGNKRGGGNGGNGEGGGEWKRDLGGEGGEREKHILLSLALLLMLVSLNPHGVGVGVGCNKAEDEIYRLWIRYCLSQGFYSCTNIMAKKQVGEERVYSAYSSTLMFITKESQDWNANRSESRSWCRDHGGMFFTGLLPLACSVCSLIEPKTASPGMVPPTRGLSPLITNWENIPQLDLMEVLPQLKLLSLW